jgi:integrase
VGPDLPDGVVTGEPATVANRIRSLKVLSSGCVSETYLSTALDRLRVPLVPETIIATFNDDQVQAMLKLASQPLAMTLQILLDTGLRISETLRLAWDDVLEGVLRVRDGRGGDQRVVPMGQTLDAGIRGYRDRGRPGPRGAGKAPLLLWCVA